MGEHDGRLDRLDELGLAVGGIAHDFRSVLQVIQFGLDSLEQHLHVAPSGPDVADALTDLRQALTTGNAMVARLYEIARRDPPPAAAHNDLVDVIRRTVNLVRRTFQRSIVVEYQLPQPLVVAAIELDLTQIIVNLVVNARDAMPDGGTLLITAAVIDLDDAAAAALGVRSAGRHVDCRVIDTGTGMSPDTMSRIFEPLFTTKPAGVGTGIGLPTVYGIVRRHGGNVLVESWLDVGSTFRVLIPHAID